LFPTGDGSVRVFLIKVVRHALASINGLPKEEGTLYIMPDRLLYIYLIDEDAQVNLKRGMRIDIMHARYLKLALRALLCNNIFSRFLNGKTF
jgi:hypothetical protein